MVTRERWVKAGGQLRQPGSLLQSACGVGGRMGGGVLQVDTFARNKNGIAYQGKRRRLEGEFAVVCQLWSAVEGGCAVDLVKRGCTGHGKGSDRGLRSTHSWSH
jgi:hypothetical protein